MRAGDHVYHRPSQETWVVAYVDGEYLGWCGWPEGEALVSDCELVKACSDDEHVALLERLVKVGGKRAYRARVAFERSRSPLIFRFPDPTDAEER